MEHDDVRESFRHSIYLSSALFVGSKGSYLYSLASPVDDAVSCKWSRTS